MLDVYDVQKPSVTSDSTQGIITMHLMVQTLQYILLAILYPTAIYIMHDWLLKFSIYKVMLSIVCCTVYRTAHQNSFCVALVQYLSIIT